MARRIRRAVKGVSPVLATLILIVVAVIAGLLIYGFVMGQFGRWLGGASEQITLKGFYIDTKIYSTGQIRYYLVIENTGTVAVKIVKVRIQSDHSWNEIGTSWTLKAGKQDKLEIRTTEVYTPGSVVTIEVYTEAGGKFSRNLGVEAWNSKMIIILDIDFRGTVGGNYYRYYVDLLNAGKMTATIDWIKVVFGNYSETDNDPSGYASITIESGEIKDNIVVDLPQTDPETNGSAPKEDDTATVYVYVYFSDGSTATYYGDLTVS